MVSGEIADVGPPPAKRRRGSPSCEPPIDGDVTGRYFAEESGQPRLPHRPQSSPPREEFSLCRNDAIEDYLPPAPGAKILSIHFDSRVLHTIALLQYRRVLSETHASAASVGSVPEESVVSVPLLDPAQTWSNQLTDSSAEVLLRKSVTLLAAHVGFDDMLSSAVNAFARVLTTKILSMWKNIRLSQERRLENLETASPSSLMHALRLEKITEAVQLRDFYNGRVVERRDRLLALCREGRQALLEMPQRRVPAKVPGRQVIWKDPPPEDDKKTIKLEVVDPEEMNFLETGD